MTQRRTKRLANGKKARMPTTTPRAFDGINAAKPIWEMISSKGQRMLGSLETKFGRWLFENLLHVKFATPW